MVDRTPYAESECFGASAFQHTCWWVMTASAQRIAHLALLPASSASRRFLARMTLLLAFSFAGLQMGLAGWRTLTNAPPASEASASAPTGNGWYRLAYADPPPPFRIYAEPVAVWWSPAQAILAAVGSFVATVLVVWILVAIQRGGARRRLGPQHLGEGRFDAAIAYGTAWLVLLLPAAGITALVHVADISAVADSPVIIPSGVFFVPGLALAVVGLCGYGFGLIRISATAPVGVRTRVIVFFAWWSPLIGAVVVAGAVAGLYLGLDALALHLDLAW
ncbi:MAG: hypothetical protein GY842_07215 [bacterium]|nr:hypothetical protein [bacterium]